MGFSFRKKLRKLGLFSGIILSDYYTEVMKGFTEFKKTGVTPSSAYYAMRNLFIATKGESNKILSSMIDNIKLPIHEWQNGVLGLKTDMDLKMAIDEMRKNGYHIFSNLLSDQQIEKIVDFSKNNKCEWCSSNKNDEVNKDLNSIQFSENFIHGPRCDYNQNDLIKSNEIMDIVFDSSILNFAQEYLECMPKLDLLAMWWSFPFRQELKSEAAQMYHFDLDRLKFIKFFFYLTDVNDLNGPHCYVKGSHSTWNDCIDRDGRYTDNEIRSAFGDEKLIEIKGKKGTIIAVDTIGIHKGKDLIEGERLLFQIEFANSLFGQNYIKPSITEKEISKYSGYKNNINSHKDFFYIID